MFYKKIILLFLLPLCVYAADAKTERKELLDYSDIYINNKIGFYAARVYMQHFDTEQAYSIGMLLHKEKNASTEFGFGYMQPSAQIDSMLNSSFLSSNGTKEEGMLFFMHYHF